MLDLREQLLADLFLQLLRVLDRLFVGFVLPRQQLDRVAGKFSGFFMLFSSRWSGRFSGEVLAGGPRERCRRRASRLSYLIWLQHRTVDPGACRAHGPPVSN
jgi:hypothetical protein